MKKKNKKLKKQINIFAEAFMLGLALYFIIQDESKNETKKLKKQ